MHCICEEPELTQNQIDLAVDQVLTASLTDAQQHGGVCPLCGHSKRPPFWNRRSILFLLALASTLLLLTLVVFRFRQQQTSRSEAATAALTHVENNLTSRALLGSPIRITSSISGDVTQDETGWQEAHLAFVVTGPKGDAQATANAGRSSDHPWSFSKLTVIAPQLHKKADLISNAVVTYDSAAYVDLHTESARNGIHFIRSSPPPHTISGSYPCVFEDLTSYAPEPTLGDCGTPVGHTGAPDRFEADLRFGSFVLRQADLRIQDIFDVPLTRSYRSDDWVSDNPSHAFGNNSNHPYDIAPRGTRNPYTYQYLALEDGDLLYFDRISEGTGYTDAVYQHTETSSRFYKATQSWNGHGWTLRFADNSSIDFPESYSAKNLAQGAATSEHNSEGDELKFVRDPRRNLLQILTPHAHSIRFQYDGQDRITSARDDQGNWSTYTYTPQGMLQDARHSSGQNDRHYIYSGMLLTEVQDSIGRTMVRNTYQGGMLVRQAFPNDRVFTYTYRLSPNRWYAQSATITFPNGDQQLVDLTPYISTYFRNQAMPGSAEPHFPRGFDRPLYIFFVEALTIAGLIALRRRIKNKRVARPATSTES